MSGNVVNCHWSSENLLAEYREELSEPDSRSLIAHVEHCETCRDDRREMVILQEALASIPALEPAAGSFDALKAAISTDDSNAGTKRRGHLLYLGGAFIAAAAAVLFFLLPSFLPSVLPPPPPAPLTSLEGQLTVSGAPVATGTEFTPAEGAQIVTGSLALLSFATPRAGEFTLAEGTKLTCIAEGRFRLDAGRLFATIEPGPRLARDGLARNDPIRNDPAGDGQPGDGTFLFETPMGTVEVAGTTFDLDLTTGKLIVSVLSGAVTLRTGPTPVRVDSGTGVTVAPGGQPGPPQPVDPYQVKSWCHTPTARVEVSPDRLRLILANETVRPVVLKPYDSSVGVYALRIDGAAGAEDVKLLVGMFVIAPDGRTTPRTLKPGETYELVIDPRRLGLSPGSYTVRAVYNPYTNDLPTGAWRGVLISPPADILVP